MYPAVPIQRIPRRIVIPLTILIKPTECSFPPPSFMLKSFAELGLWDNRKRAAGRSACRHVLKLNEILRNFLEQDHERLRGLQSLLTFVFLFVPPFLMP
jgi:hypothetical protein